jgi:hypothetical protein
VIANADMRVGEVRQFCKLDESGKHLIRAAMGQMNLSVRGFLLQQDYKKPEWVFLSLVLTCSTSPSRRA